MKRLTVALVLAAAACSSSTTKTASPPTTVARCVNEIPAGTHTYRGRAYRLALPQDDGARHPMIVLFHGFASDKDKIELETRMDVKGRARGYIVVTPDGVGSPKSWSFVGTADFAFADGLVALLERALCVNDARVFIAGHSAGSAFAGFFVCRAPYRFAGVAMVSATIPSSCPPNVTPAVIGIHGTADPVVLYNGGLGIGQTVPIPPFRQTIANIAKRSGCRGGNTDTPAHDVERVIYKGCQVEMITNVGGGHPWPPFATTAILDFFDRVR